MGWNPSIGAWPEGPRTRFRVWAPAAKALEVIVARPGGSDLKQPLQVEPNGYYSVALEGVKPGDLYQYRVNDENLYPDPASRYQPQGVHGPSMVVQTDSFSWTDQGWRGPRRESLVIYELHVGTFSPAGTFRGVIDGLPMLADLGITAVELMPLNDFPGDRNWGYDGVSLFAPARRYGTPDELRQLVDEAHRLQIAVILDVVYNHLGPDGNYTGAYSPYYFTPRHRSPWGEGVNLDGEHSDAVRQFFFENAQYWVHEFHMDGLRLDATHAMVDESSRHFLAELTARARSSAPDRRVVVIAEDHRNLSRMIRPEKDLGWELDGVWSDDFHHAVRRYLTGDHEGYYARYAGTTQEMARAIQDGWAFPGDADPKSESYDHYVFCLQNHDQIGNRARGDRLHQDIDGPTYRAVSALLLMSPEVPLLFMGQEWAASSPFIYFTDHHEDLGRRVTEGRREEFKAFAAFRSPEVRHTIPDPQEIRSYADSRLRWEEREQPEHQRVLALYRRLLHLRRNEPALQDVSRTGTEAVALDESTIAVLRRHGTQPLLCVVKLRGRGSLDLAHSALASSLRGWHWRAVLTTEDPAFEEERQSPSLVLEGAAAPHLSFHRPGAVIVRGTHG